jgi:hypothetical protein
MVPKAVRRYTFSRSPRATHVNANPIRERRRPPGRQSGRKMAMSVANPSNRRHRHRDFFSRSGPGGVRRDCHDGAPFSRNASAGRRRVILSRVDRSGSTEPNRQIPCRPYWKSSAAALNLLSKCSYQRRFLWSMSAARPGYCGDVRCSEAIPARALDSGRRVFRRITSTNTSVSGSSYRTGGSGRPQGKRHRTRRMSLRHDRMVCDIGPETFRGEPFSALRENLPSEK